MSNKKSNLEGDIMWTKNGLVKNENGLYGVTTMFFDNGNVIARGTKPTDTEGTFKEYDCYVDYFPKKEDAENFISEALEIG